MNKPSMWIALALYTLVTLAPCRAGQGSVFVPGELACWTHQAEMMVAITMYKASKGVPKVRVTPELQAELTSTGLLAGGAAHCAPSEYHVARGDTGKPTLACRTHGSADGAVTGTAGSLGDRVVAKAKRETKGAMAGMACLSVCRLMQSAIMGLDMLKNQRITALTPETLDQLKREGLLDAKLTADPAGGDLANYVLEDGRDVRCTVHSPR